MHERHISKTQLYRRAILSFEFPFEFEMCRSYIEEATYYLVYYKSAFLANT